MGDGSANLPPGFHFYPTDEELILHFLYPKVLLLPCRHEEIVPDLDLCSHNPWELDGKALSSGNQWYFFSPVTENRVTGNGYWKQSDIDEPIFTSAGKKVGIKTYHAFYIGEAPAGIETNWVLHEYRLCSGKLSGTSYKQRGNRKLDCSKWILCRVYDKSNYQQGGLCADDDGDNDSGIELSCLDEIFLSLDDELDEISLPN